MSAYTEVQTSIENTAPDIQMCLCETKQDPTKGQRLTDRETTRAAFGTTQSFFTTSHTCDQTSEKKGVVMK